MNIDQIILGDCLESLKTFPDGIVNTCITSPPYYGLRDYGCEGQIGLEETPQEYVDKLVDVFREVKRVLRDDGTLWLNLGDSYSGSGKGQTREGSKDPKRGKTNGMKLKQSTICCEGLKPKDLIGIPWRVAFALQEDGWHLRQDIIWHKPNPMPESVTDRCTKAHEYIFLLSKSQKYYYNADAIKEKAIYGGTEERKDRATDGQRSCPDEMKNGIRPHKNLQDKGQTPHTMHLNRVKDPLAGLGRISYGGKRNGIDGEGQESFVSISENRNKRSVWTVTTKPCSLAHFATFPEDLILPCVLAGCPQGGTILDPFSGAGTTALVAKKNGCHYLGCELNPKYIGISDKRLSQEYLFI